MGKRDKKTDGGNDKLTRIAVVNHDRCKPKRCNHECKRSCPVVRMGKQCIEVKMKYGPSKIHFFSKYCESA